jgi:hypothetical protein
MTQIADWTYRRPLYIRFGCECRSRARASRRPADGIRHGPSEHGRVYCATYNRDFGAVRMRVRRGCPSEPRRASSKVRPTVRLSRARRLSCRSIPLLTQSLDLPSRSGYLVEDAEGFLRDQSLLPVLANHTDKSGSWFALSNLRVFSKEPIAKAWVCLTAPEDWRGMHPTALAVLNL